MQNSISIKFGSISKCCHTQTNYLPVSHYINNKSFPTKTLTFAAAFSALGYPIPWPIETAPTAWSSVRHSLHWRSPWRPLAQVGSSSLLKSVCQRGIMNRLGSWLMVTFFLALLSLFTLLVMFLIAMAGKFLISILTFNPIEPATSGTAWSMPAIDPLEEISLMLLALSVVCGYFLGRKHGLFYNLPLVNIVLTKEGFPFHPAVCLPIALVLFFPRQSWSCLMCIWFQFRIIFISLVILLFMFVVVMVDIKIYATVEMLSFVVVSVIAFSLRFLLPQYPTGKLEGLISISCLILLGLHQCSTDRNCAVGLYCQFCRHGTWGSRCVPLPITDPFKLINNSLPFNKYAFLTTHNSYAITGRRVLTGFPRITLTNQEDSITQQLNNGVRALMLDTYDFEGDIWLCHSHGGECFDFTAFGPAIDTMKEIEAFLSQNPSEIITLILEDYVQAPNGLTKLFNDSGLSKYWFPLSNMPLNGQDWPLVSDMVANNQRLLVFTSIKSKQDTEGIAYQWNYMVENQHGDDGRHPGICSNRNESSPLHDRSKSLVLVNFFKKFPFEEPSCAYHGRGLINMLHTCYGAAGGRWANFVAVDYYKRSDEVPFQAVNTLNGKLLCGCDDVHACVRGSTAGTGTPLCMHDASIKYMKWSYEL